MKSETVDIAQELFELLSQIKGVVKVSEEVTLSYIVQVDSEESRSGAETVGVTLQEQAKNYGFDLDIIVVTEEEVAEAKRRLEEHQASQN